MQLTREERSILFFHAGAELYGADKILHVLVQGLVHRGWTVLVVLPWNGELRTVLEQAGAKVLVINHGVLRRKYFSPCGLLDRLGKIVKTGFQLARVARENRISVVHTNTSVVFAGALTAKLARIPHIWHIHEITTRPKAVWKTLSWLIPRLATRVVCVSQAVLSHLIAGDKRNAAQGKVLYNGISPMGAGGTERALFRREVGIRPDEIVVGMVGRVNNWKGQMALADAAEIVVAHCPNVRFVFVGGTFSGEEHLMTALLERVATAPLAGKVTVLDFRKDIASVMAALDIFVLPSTQPDPLPTVVLEAMSLGRAVVGFAHGGICEMAVHGETGLLVPPCDNAALAGAIERLVSDAELRQQFAIAGKRRFEEYFTVDAFLNGFEEVYEKIIHR